MKKSICLMLVALLLVAVMAPTAYATARGETVTVSVTATGDAFAGLSGTMSYDADALTYVSCSSATGTPMFNPNGGYFSWYTSENVSGTVTTISVTFTVKDNAPCGSADISVSNILVGNKDGVAVDASVSVGSVSVDHIPGASSDEVHIAGDCVTDRCVDTVVKCAKCGEEMSRTHNATTASGHSYDNGVVTTNPTCTDKGVKTYTCSACGHSYTEDVAALGHSYDNGVVTTNPTCTDKGVKTYTCSACGHSYTEDVAALGHSYDNGVVTTNPTCTDKGVKTYTCSGCGHSYTEEIDALGHDYKCTQKDETNHTCKCSRCGSSYDEAHTWGPNGKTCTKCGYTKNDPTTPTKPGAGGDMGDTTPYPAFFLLAVAAVMGTAYGFKRKFEI